MPENGGSTIPLPAPPLDPPAEPDDTGEDQPDNPAGQNLFTMTEPPAVSFQTVSDYNVLPDIGNIVSSPTTFYLNYGITIDYQFDFGLRDQPLAAPSRAALVDFVRIHTGKCRKIVTVMGTTAGTLPPIPSSNQNNPNYVLLYQQVGSFAPKPMPDGTPVYGVFVRYIFGAQQMPSPTDMLDMGTVPFDTGVVGANTINPAAFVTNLIGPAAPISSGASTPITY